MRNLDPWPSDPARAREVVAMIASEIEARSWFDNQQLLTDLCCAAWPSVRAQGQ